MQTRVVLLAKTFARFLVIVGMFVGVATLATPIFLAMEASQTNEPSKLEADSQAEISKDQSISDQTSSQSDTKDSKSDFEDEKQPWQTESEVFLPSEDQNGRHKTSLCPCSNFQSFIQLYRSSNPQSKITPFAIVLLAVLLLIYILNQADRLVLAILIPSGLRCDDTSNSNTSDDSCPVHISSNDTELVNPSNNTDCIYFNDAEQGLLTGPAFIVIYVVAGLPLAWLADTRSRSLVLLIGVGFWSAIVVLTGFVRKFWELLLLRILLGVGEASFNPVAYSLMADFFPPRNRAFVFSIYHYGVYFGGAFGWMSGAINNVLNWRWTFRLLGIVGFILLPMALLAMWEPKNIRERRKQRIKGKARYSIREVFVYLIKCPPYMMLLVAGSIRNISGYALGYWLPTYYVRVFQLDSGYYGTRVGLVVLFGGGIGCFLGGILSDWLSRYRKGAKAFVIAVTQLLAAPSIIGVLMVNSPTASFGLLVIAYITAETWLGPAAAIVQDVTLPAMRAQASAVYIGVITIVASIGPVLVPAFLDIPAFSDCIGIRYALLCTVPTFYGISAVLFWILGMVMKCWVTKQKQKSNGYATFTDEVDSDPIRDDNSGNQSSQSRSSPSSEW